MMMMGNGRHCTVCDPPWTQHQLYRCWKCLVLVYVLLGVQAPAFCLRKKLKSTGSSSVSDKSWRVQAPALSQTKAEDTEVILAHQLLTTSRDGFNLWLHNLLGYSKPGSNQQWLCMTNRVEVLSKAKNGGCGMEERLHRWSTLLLCAVMELMGCNHVRWPKHLPQVQTLTQEDPQEVPHTIWRGLGVLTIKPVTIKLQEGAKPYSGRYYFIFKSMEAPLRTERCTECVKK